MYTTVKKLAMACFVISIFCILAALLLLIEFSGYNNFTLKFTWSLYVITTSGGFMFLSWALFNLSKDLDREYSSNAEYLHKLNMRIKQLEDKTNA